VAFPDRPATHGVQWRIDGKRKTKVFPTRERQIAFAKELAGEAKTHGLANLRLDEDETRDWRAFRATIGDDADLQSVAACWLKHRAAHTREPLGLNEAIETYCAAKKAEGVSPAAVSHYGPIFDRLKLSLGNPQVASVTAEQIAAFMADQEGSPQTLRTRFARVRALFNWLADTNRIDGSPFRGMKPPKVQHKEVEILTLEQTKKLFFDNYAEDPERRETLGRLALEAFAGLRNDTAAQIVANEIQADGLRIPAAKIKTAQPQFLDGLPENLFVWLKWSQPDSWTMTPRQYATAKAAAFIQAKVPHPHNCLRHGFASYHVAAVKDPSKTSVIMCHTSAKLLWDVYRGIASEADGKALFKIMPGKGRASK
jgi:integrase